MHTWDVSPKEAVSLQRRLAPMVDRTGALPVGPGRVAGLDISPPGPDGMVTAAAVVVSYPAMEVEEVSVAQGVPGFPYVPGLLSFRETPVLVDALEGLRVAPDLIIADGQGLAHPRRFGLACHIGVIADTPTLGCAKSRLWGEHGPVEPQRGSRVLLVDGDEVIGVVLRTRDGVKPVYVSVGHKLDLASAAEWVLACCGRFRLPEPSRLAHKAAAGLLGPGAPVQHSKVDPRGNWGPIA